MLLSSITLSVGCNRLSWLDSRSCLATILVFFVCVGSAHVVTGQDVENASPHVVLMTGEIVSGQVDFSRRSLRNNFITVNETRYRLNGIAFFSDDQHTYGRTSTNLILKRIESGRVDLFADFDWTNAAPIFDPENSEAMVGPRIVRNGYYSKNRRPLKKLTADNLNKDLADNAASLKILRQHKMLGRVQWGLVVAGTGATSVALLTSEPGRKLPVSVVPGVILAASAVIPHFLKRTRFVDAVRVYNR